jgi:hypothetical protein
VAKSTITSELEGMVAHSDGSEFSQRLAEEIREAVASLPDSSSELAEPLPVTAELSTYGPPNALSLKVQWIDPLHESTGIYVIDHNGQTFEFKNSILWGHESTANAWTQRAFLMNFYGEAQSVKWNPPNSDPSIGLPWDAATVGQPKVGLTTTSGRSTKAINLIVRVPDAMRHVMETRPTTTDAPQGKKADGDQNRK